MADLPRTLIVGGGIGGLTAATALAREGAEVRVVEQAPAFAAIGAGITIQANAMAVLRALGIELAADDVVPIGGVELVDARGRVLTGGDPDAILPDPPSLNAHRADLHRTLVEASQRAGVSLVTGTVVSAARDEGDCVKVQLEDGPELSSAASEEWPLVIAADGARSRLRAALLPDEARELRYSGQTCWRFALDAPDLVPEVTTERWAPGRRAGVVPMSRGRIYVYLVKSEQRGTPGPGSASPKIVRRHFSGIDAALDRMLERLDDSTVVHHDDLCDRPNAFFGRGRILLLGDAAHPMTPNMGQGAGTAIEDGGALALLVPRYAARISQLAAAFDAERRDRVTSVQRMSWRIGRVAHWQNRLSCTVRDLLMRSVPARAADRQARALWQPGIDLARQITAQRSG